jgi:hypothetical protein
MIKKSDIVIGAKVYTSIKDEPWTIIEVDDVYASMIRPSVGGIAKVAKINGMLYRYILFGSEQDINMRKDYQRRGWPVWQE